VGRERFEPETKEISPDKPQNPLFYVRTDGSDSFATAIIIKPLTLMMTSTRRRVMAEHGRTEILLFLWKEAGFENSL